MTEIRLALRLARKHDNMNQSSVYVYFVHPSLRPSVRPSVHPLLDLSIYVYLSSVPIYRSSLSTCLSFYLSIHLRIHLSIHSYVYKICSFIYLFIYLLIYMYEKYAHVHTFIYPISETVEPCTLCLCERRQRQLANQSHLARD